jgi:hypothetical protein
MEEFSAAIQPSQAISCTQLDRFVRLRLDHTGNKKLILLSMEVG